MNKLKINKTILLIALVATLPIFLFSQETKTPVWYSGNDRVRDLITPGLGAFGATILYNESPVMDSINPALSAFRQRMTVGFGYTGLFGQMGHDISTGVAENGAFGHLFSVGFSAPTQVGVFTVSGQYANGSALEFAARNQGGFNLSYSRDVFDDLYFGLGVNVHLGEALATEENPLWMAGLDLGIIHMPGTVGPINDFVWGVTLQNLGWGTLPLAVQTGTLPDASIYSLGVAESLFTIEAAFSFTAVEKDDFKLSYHADIAFPALVNMRLKTGFGFHFKDELQFNISTTIDARELAGAYPYQKASTSSLLPAIGFTYRYKDKKAKQPNSDSDISFNEMHIHSSATPITDTIWATGVGFTIPLGIYDVYAPEIELFPEFEEDVIIVEPLSSAETLLDKIDYLQITDLKATPLAAEDILSEFSLQEDEIPKDTNIQYHISPNLDGVKDSFTLPFRVKDKRYIMGFNFVVYNDKGECVKLISNKEERKENEEPGFFKRLFRKESGITIPDQISWDGTNNIGQIMPDGLYYIQLEVWDDNNNLAKSRILPVSLDNTPPTITLNKPKSNIDQIFSPNNDRQKDIFPINQSGSSEFEWNATISSDFLGVIKNYKFSNQQPENIEWNGLTNQGFLAPDGVYHYEINATDLAGNTTSDSIKNIILNTEQTPIRISIDKNSFSPNNDGINDYLVLTTDIPVTTGILNWEMQILTEENTSVWKEEGTTSVPTEIQFSQTIPEGNYKAQLNVLYNNGNQPKSVSPLFSVDLTPPQGNVASDQKIFSPDGDGLIDEIVFRHDTSKEAKWISSIKNAENEEIVAFEWLNFPPEKFAWDGYAQDGQLVPDGDYYYELKATDLAGNPFIADKINFSINTKPTFVKITATEVAFSPNNDKVKDQIKFTHEISDPQGISKFNLDIITPEGELVRNLTRTLPLQNQYFWDGFTNDGSKAIDGQYMAKINVAYTKGNIEESFSRTFDLDTVAPEVSVAIDESIFSPNNDGFKDKVSFTHTSSNEERWVANIINNKNTDVREFQWSGNVEDFNWFGTDENGNLLPDGTYKYEISSTDAAGNKGSFVIPKIEMDTRSTKIFMTLEQNIISPNNDDYLEVAEIKTLFNLTDGIENWKLEFIDINDPTKVIKSYNGEEFAPESVVWDGTDENGNVAEGVYIPTLTAIYKKGDRVTEITEPIMVDISAPNASVQISPDLFSPDNDGVNDELSIAFDVKDLSGVEKWVFNIYDPKGRNFKQFKGAGNPTSALLWDGKSYKGDLVVSAEDYAYKFQLVDKAGNVSEVDGKIPVDVLVIRDGDRLKIMISNLNFKANSAELETNDPSIVARNNYVLERLKHILTKYGSYNIQIEGHANAINWYDPIAAEKEEVDFLLPLSKSRAESIMKQLISMGIASERLSAKGMGGKFPVVDARIDRQNWDINKWQNRRVEFILVK